MNNTYSNNNLSSTDISDKGKKQLGFSLLIIVVGVILYLILSDPVRIYKKGTEAYSNKEYSSAIIDYSQFRDKYPNNKLINIVNQNLADSYIQYAEININDGSFSLAIENYKEFLKDFPDHESTAQVKADLSSAYVKLAEDKLAALQDSDSNVIYSLESIRDLYQEAYDLNPSNEIQSKIELFTFNPDTPVVNPSIYILFKGADAKEITLDSISFGTVLPSNPIKELVYDNETISGLPITSSIRNIAGIYNTSTSTVLGESYNSYEVTTRNFAGAVVDSGYYEIKISISWYYQEFLSSSFIMQTDTSYWVFVP